MTVHECDTRAASGATSRRARFFTAEDIRQPSVRYRGLDKILVDYESETC